MELLIIQKKIFEVRGQKIMLDFHLAELYDTETRALNQAVRRNLDIFPKDFMFRLTKKEWKNMSSQIVMTYPQRRPKVSPPLAFTEHGVTMLANVLKSRKARKISVSIVRAFIALKQFAMDYKELQKKLGELEAKYNKQFKDIYEALNYLMQREVLETEQKNRKRIGYKS
jgi:hypothetical protein